MNSACLILHPPSSLTLEAVVSALQQVDQQVLHTLASLKVSALDDFVLRDIDVLAPLCDSLEDDVRLLYSYCVDLRAPTLSNAAAMLETSLSVPYVSLTTPVLDQLLGGYGLKCGHVLCLYGDSGSAKSVICAEMTAQCAVQGGNVLYIDTGCEFLLRRCAKSVVRAQQNQAEQEKVATRIRVRSATDVFAVLDALQECENQLESEFKLIVLDNVASLLAPVVTGGNFIGVGLALLARLARALKIVAMKTNAAIVVVNHASQLQPALGRMWRFAPHQRLLLERMPPRESYVVRATLVQDRLGERNHAFFRIGNRIQSVVEK